LLGTETARGRKTEKEEKNSSLYAAYEGFLSIAQFLNLLLADKIPGYDDPHALVDDLLTPHDGKLNSSFVAYTSRLRMNTLGPTTLSGGRFKNPVAMDERGHLKLTPAFLAELKNLVHEQSVRGVELASFENHRRNLSCPVASAAACMTEKVGLQYASDVFWKIYQIVEHSE
jgi:hypothetical protein